MAEHCAVGVCSSRVHCKEIGRCFSAPSMDPQRVRELAAADIEAAFQRGKRAGYSEGFRAGHAGVAAGEQTRKEAPSE